MKHLLLSAACIALLTGCATTSNTTPAPVTETPKPVAQDTPPPAPAKPTAAEAKAYADDAEKQLAALSEAANHAAWARATYIIHDTEWLETKANAALTEATVKLALGAAKFNDVEVDADTRRKLDLLRLSQVLPAADRPGAAEELAALTTKLDSIYSTGKFTYKQKTYNLTDASNVMATSFV
jgi:peptidyl-dipeptidase A